MSDAMMGKGRIVLGYLAAPLAAAVAAALVLAVQDVRAISYLLPSIGLLYVLAFVPGVAACFLIRLLPTRSAFVYVLWGVVVGGILAPGIQQSSDILAHGHQPAAVSNLVWQVVRAAIAGGSGLGVFWFIVARSANHTVDADAGG